MDMSVKLNLSYPAQTTHGNGANKTAEAPRADSVTAVVGSKNAEPDNLKLAVQQIEKFVQSVKRNLEFSIDETSGKVVVKVIASETGEVVRQIPSEEVLKLAEHLHDAGSVLFEAKV